MTIFNVLFESIDLSAFTRVPEIGINSVIEIFILTYVIYKFIFWVKRTTAWPLFRGIVVFLAVALLAYLFRLHALWWMITNAFSVGVIALMIIFQPELRTALDRIGKNKIMSFLNQQSADVQKSINNESAEEIISAVMKLAEEKTGAFIVIEHEVSLENYEATGTALDAKITAGLLVNIFVDKTPLHDGAVLIKKNRISAASCIMPLTKTEIGAEFGTRHRAAVGTSEVTDADIIVVSEETGRISVAKEGTLYKKMTRSDLESLLLKSVQPQKRRGLRWKGWGENEKNS